MVLSFSPDLSFPSLVDMRATVGGDILLFKVVTLSGAYSYDLREAAGIEPARSLPFSFGISFTFSTNIQQNIGALNATERGWNRSDVSTTIAAVPLQNGVWGFGAGVNVPLGSIVKTPPAISLDTSGEKYISPTLVGGKVDLVLPLSITSKRYVKGFRLVIQDSSGNPVRTIQNKEDRPENRDLGNLLKRLVYVKQGIPIPPSVRWDGTSDKGTVVPDGTYRYYVEAWDDNGNIGKTPLGTGHCEDRAAQDHGERAVRDFLPDRGRDKGELSPSIKQARRKTSGQGQSRMRRERLSAPSPGRIPRRLTSHGTARTTRASWRQTASTATT